MSMPAWTDEVKERARRERKYLVKLQVQGKHAGDGMIAIAGDVGPDVAKKLMGIIGEVLAEERAEVARGIRHEVTS